MRDLLSWNIYFGRLAGIHLRLHAGFFLLAAFAVAARDTIPLWYSLTGVGMLFFSVAGHELARSVAAVKAGGSVDQVLLWPLGGLLSIRGNPLDPLQEWPTSVAGLLANLGVCAFVLPIFLVSGMFSKLHFNPLSLPPHGESFEWQSGLALLFWINWVLLLVNLLPAAPLDGARLLRFAIWPRQGFRAATLQVARAGRVTAVALLVIGLVASQSHPLALAPLSVLAAFLFFANRREVEPQQDADGDDAIPGYDFSQGYTSLEQGSGLTRKPKFSGLRKWLHDRREERDRRRRETEEHEDERVDAVLARLHQSGLEGLSSDERALLHRVSTRYRNRHRT